MATLDPALLAKLPPISTLSPGRLQELADLCFIEKVSKDIDPFRMNITQSAQALYLLKGDLGLLFADGSKKILRGGSEAANHAVDPSRLALQNTIALTEIEIVRIDLDLLDIMMTWDQLAGYESSAPHVALIADAEARSVGAWMSETGVFSAEKLQDGVFGRLPPSNVEEMFRRMATLQVKAGQVMIMQGAEGDYYYLIESGIAQVTRVTQAGAPPFLLAELEPGAGFGEEALVSDNKRNATVTMKTDGVLLRLNKSDFIELLKAPLIIQVSKDEARKKVQDGAIWLDVRFPSEYKFDHLPGALNVPLNEIRESMRTLDNSRQYVTYCQTGRRSSAAAFILVQHGFDALVLKDGTKADRR